MDKLHRLRDAKGVLPSFAKVGAYPLYYVTEKCEALCPDCANNIDPESNTLSDARIHWEGDPIYCDDCSKEIETAYDSE